MGGEVHDGIDSLQCPAQLHAIKDIASYQLESRGEQLVARTKVVKNDDIVTRSPQSSRCMTSYISCAANDQNHQCSSPFRTTEPLHGRSSHCTHCALRSFHVCRVANTTGYCDKR